MSIIADVFPKIDTDNDVVTEMSKKKSERQHFYHIVHFERKYERHS